MTQTGIVIDPRFKLHLTGQGHPERPARMDAVESALNRQQLLEMLLPVAIEPASQDLMLRVHSPEYLARLEAACRSRQPYIDSGDSAICPESFDIARLAAGGVVNAARMIASGRLQRAFCAVRPPGHHCEVGESMGFCLLNNVAIAARALQNEFALERILILDWDVHHGNGTQHIFEADPRVLYISIHGHPRHLYPGTGYAEETGIGAGRGYTLNVPLMPGADDDTYREAFESAVIPKIESFKPAFFIISAGFDAHERDPLAEMLVTQAGFDFMSRAVIDLANRHADGRILSVLEGGYDLEALGDCTALHVRALME